MTPPSKHALFGNEFLDSVRKGDANAWEQLVRDYRPYLLAVARRVLADRPPGDCSSAVQDGLAVGFERAGQFRGQSGAELLGWLSRIVANKACDRLRGDKPSLLPTNAEGEDLLADDATTPSFQCTRRESAARVLEAIAGLPEDYRQVIEQRIFQNRSYDEIASSLNRTNDSVRCLWVRAIRRLRDELGEEP